MKWIETKVTFDHPDPALASDLVATVFFDLDLQGVVIEDPGLTENADLAEDAIADPEANAVVGYFVGDRGADVIADHLTRKLENIRSRTGLKYRLSYRQVDDQNWAEAWKAHFWPQRVGKHLVVKPTWREFQPERGDIIIELDPGMAFGTGTHPTTALCLALIEKHLHPGAAVLDVGTGSGILLITAALLGAGILHGLDKDELAAEVAAENIARNRIDPGKWSVRCGDLVQGVEQAYDLVVANILAPVILELLDDISGVMNPGGLFICSGIIEAHESEVVAKMSMLGLEPIEIRHQEEWVAIVAKQKSPVISS